MEFLFSVVGDDDPLTDRCVRDEDYKDVGGSFPL